MHFKELITEVMRVKAINQDNPGRLIAQMHTEINLDSRFMHQGNGEWGLREWVPKASKLVKIRPETPTVASRPRSLLREDEEEDEEEFDADEEENFAAEEGDDEEEESDPEEFDEDDQ